jgi:hypothetical protein
LIILLAAACTEQSSQGIAPGSRLITGRITLDAHVATQRSALQVVALYASPTMTCDAAGAIHVGDAAPGGTNAACGIFGAPFDPGELGGGVDAQPFQLDVPCGLTVNLVVQTIGTSGGQAPGTSLALLDFPSGVTADALTSLVATEPMCRDTRLMATNLLDLGDIVVPAVPPPAGPAAVEVGGPGGGRNPLDTIDTDQDLVPNSADDDDDNDGIPDAMDADADGDGMADGAETFQPTWLGQSS